MVVDTRPPPPDRCAGLVKYSAEGIAARPPPGVPRYMLAVRGLSSAGIQNPVSFIPRGSKTRSLSTSSNGLPARTSTR